MALIGMAVFDTEDNKRSWMTRETLGSLSRTVDWSRHRLIISDNGSCAETHKIYRECSTLPNLRVIYNGKNLGTARAVNQAWALRTPNEGCVKIDNDVVIREHGWLDKLEECIQRDPKIGIIGLKRKDLDETPNAQPGSWNQSQLIMLPHEKGQDWLVVEAVHHVMGTCQLYSAKLLEKIGYLYQMAGLYGFDDSLAATRCKIAGFYSCFYPHYRIDHIDPGNTDFQKWKEDLAGKGMAAFNHCREEYLSGRRSIHHGPSDE
jgi:GT2 family glycosyltransferase